MNDDVMNDYIMNNYVMNDDVINDDMNDIIKKEYKIYRGVIIKFDESKYRNTRKFFDVIIRLCRVYSYRYFNFSKNNLKKKDILVRKMTIYIILNGYDKTVQLNPFHPHPTK